MKYASIIDGKPKPCVIVEENKVIKLESIFGDKYETLLDFIRFSDNEDKLRIKKAAEQGSFLNLEDYELSSPIIRPIHDIICVGVNYKDHLEETKKNFGDGDFKTPDNTVFFGKRALEIMGHNSTINGHLDLDDMLDYEVELAVVVGKKIDRHSTMMEIEDSIFGYTVFNDISARNIQAKRNQWYMGKSLDGFSCMGPWIIPREEIDIKTGLNLYSKVDGELRQKSNTKYLIKNPFELLYDFSRGITIEPGDILTTGTPSGVGQGYNPPRFLKKGSVVEVGIEKIGKLINYIK